MKKMKLVTGVLLALSNLGHLQAMSPGREAFLETGKEIQDYKKSLKDQGYSESCLYVSGIEVDEDKLGVGIQNYFSLENQYEVRLLKDKIQPPVKNALARTHVYGELSGKVPGTDKSVTITASHTTLLGVGENWLDRVAFMLKQENSDGVSESGNSSQVILRQEMRFSDLYNKDQVKYSIPGSTLDGVTFRIARCPYSIRY